MSRSSVPVVAAIFAVAVILTSPAFAQSDPEVAREVIAVAKAEWEAFNKKDVNAAARSWAEEYTQFSPTFATRLEGKAQLVALEEALAGDSGGGVFSDMTNPKVQVYGDVAILSYNYIGVSKDKDGKTEPFRAKSTRVYVKKGSRWMLVHANFGADPLPD